MRFASPAEATGRLEAWRLGYLFDQKGFISELKNLASTRPEAKIAVWRLRVLEVWRP